MRRIRKEEQTCYMCDSPATTREHVPAVAFFPKGFRHQLITVPSCDAHNKATTLDDEYTRNVVVMCDSNNAEALTHWKKTVLRSFMLSQGLIKATFSQRKEIEDESGKMTGFFMDRERINSVFVKIAYGLYFHEFGKRWLRDILPLTNHLYVDDLVTDELSMVIPDYKDKFREGTVFKGTNPLIFRYRFDKSVINGVDDHVLRMTFYEGFTVWVMPLLQRGKS